MRARAPWYQEQHDTDDPHLRLLLAIIKQTVKDAQTGESKTAAAILTGWGFPPSVWATDPRRRMRTGRQPHGDIYSM